MWMNIKQIHDQQHRQEQQQQKTCILDLNSVLN